jgi:hypothetical protein
MQVSPRVEAAHVLIAISAARRGVGLPVAVADDPGDLHFIGRRAASASEVASTRALLRTLSRDDDNPIRASALPRISPPAGRSTPST